MKDIMPDLSTKMYKSVVEMCQEMCQGMIYTFQFGGFGLPLITCIVIS